MYSCLLSHVKHHFASYKLLVFGSAAAVAVGAIAAIVYDNQAPHPWDVFAQEQQQAIAATTTKATTNGVFPSRGLPRAIDPIPTVETEAGDSNPKQYYRRAERTAS